MKSGMNSFSNPIYCWADPADFTEMPQLHDNCAEDRIRYCVDGIRGASFESVEYFPEGSYYEEGKTQLTNIGAFYRVTIRDQITRDRSAQICVYLPVKWNQRLWGIAGAALNTEFDWFIFQHSTLTSWPMALINGFASVTNEGGIGREVNHYWGFDERGHFDWQWFHYYASDAVHRNALIAKAVLKAAYGKAPDYSYLMGCSAGGRQTVSLAQRFPEDYDGYWADCPSINMVRILFGMVWPSIVFNNEQHDVSTKKFRLAYSLVVNSPLRELEYDPEAEEWQSFFKALLGQPTDDGAITEKDLEIMRKIWDGPKTRDGKAMCWGIGPGIIQWPTSETRPFGYLRRKDGSDLGACEYIPSIYTLFKWFALDPTLDVLTMSYEDFEALYYEAERRFAEFNTYNPDLTAMEEWGSKLLITHGTGDFLVPYQTIQDYYAMAAKHFLGEGEMNKSFCLFMLPHAGHSFYDWDGPNVTVASAAQTIMGMVEKHIVPDTIEAVRYDFEQDKALETTAVERYCLK